jgi:hypothetical protein
VPIDIYAESLRTHKIHGTVLVEIQGNRAGFERGIGRE